MSIVGALVFGLAVLVNSIVCYRPVREEKPSGEVPELPGFRFFKALAEDIPGAHTKLPGHEPVPILGPIRVLARGNFIYAWDEDELIRLIYDSLGNVKVINTMTGMMEPMTPEHDVIALQLTDLMRTRTAALLRERDIINANIAAVERRVNHLLQRRNSRN